MAQRPQIAFLHRVLGVGGIAHEIARQREHVVEMGQRGVAKTPRSVLFGMRITCHRIALGRPGVATPTLPRERGMDRLGVRPIEHHCVALLPVAASTTIVPTMCGWM